MKGHCGKRKKIIKKKEVSKKEVAWKEGKSSYDNVTRVQFKSVFLISQYIVIFQTKNIHVMIKY